MVVGLTHSLTTTIALGHLIIMFVTCSSIFTFSQLCRLAPRSTPGRRAARKWGRRPRGPGLAGYNLDLILHIPGLAIFLFVPFPKVV